LPAERLRWLPVALLGSGLVLVGLAAWLAAWTVASARVQVIASLPAPTPPRPAEPLEADTLTLPLSIRRGSNFGRLVQGLGVPAEAVLAAARPHYDLSRIRPDRELGVTWADGDEMPVAVRYDIDEDRTLLVQRDGESWAAVLTEVAYVAEPGARRFEIRRSLWQDGIAAGLRPAGIVRLASIFEYELDFNTELRPGASFAVVADVLRAPERTPRLGDIHAIRLINGDQAWSVFRHRLPDGSEGWYREDGSSLRRPFLRSPLEFSRVTSGFNPQRFHPILKQTRPHNGTDFGAPTGTPVRVVADGKVVRATWSGGHGRFVKVEHDGGYATSYSHLARIDVKAGARVRQGQVVGTVGASGLATGPHLHYQMWHKGRFVDPLKVALPNQAPLPASERAAFAETVARWKTLFDAAEAAPEAAEPSPDDSDVDDIYTGDDGDPLDGADLSP
jgi:murein DD-endopeptidase MepM/ murein hydrolase activator NlpD